MAVIRQSYGCHMAVVRHSYGSHMAVVRHSYGSHMAVVRHSYGSHMVVVRQSCVATLPVTRQFVAPLNILQMSTAAHHLCKMSSVLYLEITTSLTISNPSVQHASLTRLLTAFCALFCAPTSDKSLRIKLANNIPRFEGSWKDESFQF
jgi:hypothetical protein